MSNRISVVLATCNGSSFLNEQLASILSQTCQPDEMVISDDNSSDGTSAILDEFQRRCPFRVVRLQNHPGKGFRENFIHASLHATGDWIAFCDQDDIWHPKKLELCSANFDDQRVTLIVHTAELIDANGEHIGLFKQGIEYNAVRPPLFYDVWHTFFGFSMVFRRELLAIGPVQSRFLDYIAPEHRIAHDRWVCFLSQVTGHTVEIATPLVKYRQHGKNLFGATSARRKINRAAVQSDNDSYIAATSEMVQIVGSLPTDVRKHFPAFDRDAALAVYSLALNQVTARGKVYDAARMSSPILIAINFAKGEYRNSHNGRQRWTSLAKDILYCVAR